MDYTTLTAIFIIVTPFHIWLFWVTAIMSRRPHVGLSVYKIIAGELTTKIKTIADEIRTNGIMQFIPMLLGGDNVDAMLGRSADTNIIEQITPGQIIPGQTSIGTSQPTFGMEHGRVGSKIRPIRPHMTAI